MNFAEPLWLLVGLIGCSVLAWAWRKHDVRQRAALAKFASPHLHEQLTVSFSTAKRKWRRGLFLASVACLFVALARPQAGFRWEEVKRRGIEVIFAVDTSRSMLTPDVKPNRLTRAKLAVDDFASHLNGDGIGLIAFAGNAFLQCPITLDYEAFHESLAALDTTVIPRGGTDIASAIREAQSALQSRPSTDKILILLTDGEDLEGSALEAAKAAAKTGLKIHAIGVGTPNGDLIPIPTDQGGGFIKDAGDQFVKSRLDETGLRAIAQATGGLYMPLGAQGQGLEAIYRQALAPLALHDLASRRQKVYTERYQWPLLTAFIFLLASLPIGTRRRKTLIAAGPLPKPIRPTVVASHAAVLVGLLTLIPSQQVTASPTTAEAAYQRGDFVAAQRDYAAAAQSDGKNLALHFNTGAAAYKAGQFPQAAEAFQKSLGGEPSANPKKLAAQENGYYNLGNTFFRTGQQTEQAKPQETIHAWERAVKAYDAALQLRSADADAKFNRDFVQTKLDELKKQQQQKERQDRQNQNENDKKQPSQSGQKSDEKGQPDQNKQTDRENHSKQNPATNNQEEKAQPPGTPNKSDQPKNQEVGSDGAKPARPKQPGQNQPPSTQDSGSYKTNAKDQASTDQNPDAPSASDAQRHTGQISREEARTLLDSAKDEEHPFPSAPVERGENAPQPDQPIKDW